MWRAGGTTLGCGEREEERVCVCVRLGRERWQKGSRLREKALNSGAGRLAGTSSRGGGDGGGDGLSQSTPPPPHPTQLGWGGRDGQRFMRKEEEKVARPRRPCQRCFALLLSFLCPRLPAIPSEASATKFHHKHTRFLPLLSATLSRGTSRHRSCCSFCSRYTSSHSSQLSRGKKKEAKTKHTQPAMSSSSIAHDCESPLNLSGHRV